MTARKRSRLNKRRKKLAKNPSNKIFKLILLFIAFVVIVFWPKSKHWNGENKLALTINTSDNVVVTIFDPLQNEITNISIPNETQVEVARDLGRIRLKNVWELGENEGIEGELLSQTVTRHFKFISYAWAESEALGFTKGGLGDFVNAATGFYQTNLSVMDRIRIAFFALGVNTSDRINIDLRDTGYIKKSKLVDGSDGYIKTGELPRQLAILFVRTNITNFRPKVKIADYTGKYGYAEELSDILSVIGYQVVAIEKGSDGKKSCLLTSKTDANVIFLKKLFGCKVVNNKDLSFDLEFQLGSDTPSKF